MEAQKPLWLTECAHFPWFQIKISSPPFYTEERNQGHMPDKDVTPELHPQPLNVLKLVAAVCYCYRDSALNPFMADGEGLEELYKAFLSHLSSC